jgi:molybdopterin synthase sulfur carrier subunit
MATSTAQDRPSIGHITLRYWASARSATGTAEEQVEADGAVSLAALIAGSVARNGATTGRADRIAEVLGCCSVLLGDRQVANQDAADVLVEVGQTVEFLPPFAGG